MRVLVRRIAFYVVTAILAVTVDFFIPRLMPGAEFLHGNCLDDQNEP